jgi:hypothetical protein
MARHEQTDGAAGREAEEGGGRASRRRGQNQDACCSRDVHRLDLKSRFWRVPQSGVEG